LMAELARLEMTFASPEDMPSVIIAKIAARMKTVRSRKFWIFTTARLISITR